MFAKYSCAFRPCAPLQLLLEHKVRGWLVTYGLCGSSRPYCDCSTGSHAGPGREAIHGDRMTANILLQEVLAKILILTTITQMLTYTTMVSNILWEQCTHSLLFSEGMNPQGKYAAILFSSNGKSIVLRVCSMN